ncbi:MAG TPA: 6-phosphogluconolactonase [bacterium]|nr:6-phosphogluconolactonase [bacterium]
MAKKPVKKKKTPVRSVRKAVKKAASPQASTKPKKIGFFPEVKLFPDAATLVQEAAPLFMQASRDAVNARGRFVAALSGGTTPKGLFQQLTEEPYRSLIPWDKCFFFWVDERHVPFDHPDSNYRMTQEFLLSKVPTPKENIFPMTNGALPVDKAANSYEIKMRKFFGSGSVPRFDLSLMGMGDDGHTASLFPRVEQLNEMEKWVVGYYVDDAKKDRVSLTFPVLNASRELLVLVSGDKKAKMLKEVLEGPKDPPRYPIQYLRPTDGKLVFMMDAPAAALLKK